MDQSGIHQSSTDVVKYMILDGGRLDMHKIPVVGAQGRLYGWLLGNSRL